MGARVIPARLAWFCVAIALLLGLDSIFARPEGASATSARYARFDVELEVRPDGSFHVTETQIVDFAAGPFRQGYRSIPLARTEGISGVRVGELVDGMLVPYGESELETLIDES